jgi:hypothetical protein
VLDEHTSAHRARELVELLRDLGAEQPAVAEQLVAAGE